jgi:hypothetical protein
MNPMASARETLRSLTGLLAVALFLQLSGLTCLQDAAGEVDTHQAGVAFAQPPSDAQPVPSEAAHECPCHHAVAAAPLFEVGHRYDLVSGLVHVPMVTPEGLPPVVFHPPLVLL